MIPIYRIKINHANKIDLYRFFRRENIPPIEANQRSKATIFAVNDKQSFDKMYEFLCGLIPIVDFEYVCIGDYRKNIAGTTILHSEDLQQEYARCLEELKQIEQ